MEVEEVVPLDVLLVVDVAEVVVMAEALPVEVCCRQFGDIIANVV